MTPTKTMQRYFETWSSGDFGAFEAQLAPEMTFTGPMATVHGAVECRAGIEQLAAAGLRPQVLRMLADGPDVITWFELHRPDGAPLAVANWATVTDGRISSVRVTFDPRPLLG